MRKSFNLTSRYDKPHSFRGNAYAIREEDGTVNLVSYATVVARVTPDGEFHKMWDDWSASTANHIRMFANEYAPEWLNHLGRDEHGKYRGTFKSNWLAMPLS